MYKVRNKGYVCEFATQYGIVLIPFYNNGSHPETFQVVMEVCYDFIHNYHGKPRHSLYSVKWKKNPVNQSLFSTKYGPSSLQPTHFY